MRAKWAGRMLHVRKPDQLAERNRPRAWRPVRHGGNVSDATRTSFPLLKRLCRLPKAAPVCFPATLMRFSNAVALPREKFGW